MPRKRRSFYRYQVSGLRVQSALALPELWEVDAAHAGDWAADVSIQPGSVPETIDSPVETGVLYQAAPGKFLLNMQGIARYFVQNGDRITIQAEPGSDENEVRLFLLGTVWAACLHQRGQLALHASGVMTPNGALLFVGRSGAGKSALASAMYKRGYAVLADDLVVAGVEDNRPIAYPFFGELRIWPDVAKAQGIAPEAVMPLRKNLPKLRQPAGRGFSPEPNSIRAIYLLTEHKEDEIELEQLRGMQRFSALLNHTFRERFLSGLGLRDVHFRQVSALANRVDIYVLKRPEQGFDFEKLVGVIEEKMGER